MYWGKDEPMGEGPCGCITTENTSGEYAKSHRRALAKRDKLLTQAQKDYVAKQGVRAAFSKLRDTVREPVHVVIKSLQASGKDDPGCIVFVIAADNQSLHENTQKLTDAILRITNCFPWGAVVDRVDVVDTTQLKQQRLDAAKQEVDKLMKELNSD